MARDKDEHKTLQDDRAALDLDAEDRSQLVAGEGAPLAEDGVADAPPTRDVVVEQYLLGGAPIPIITPLNSGSAAAPHDPITTKDDSPIDD